MFLLNHVFRILPDYFFKFSSLKFLIYILHFLFLSTSTRFYNKVNFDSKIFKNYFNAHTLKLSYIPTLKQIRFISNFCS